MPGLPANHTRHPHEGLLAMVLLSGYNRHISRLEIATMVTRMRVSDSIRHSPWWKVEVVSIRARIAKDSVGVACVGYCHCWQTNTWRGLGLGLWPLIYLLIIYSVSESCNHAS